jgi:hypothetical protein
MWGDALDVNPRSRRVVSPHAFAGAVSTLLPLFQGSEQQDAQEFLRVSFVSKLIVGTGLISGCSALWRECSGS